jgi:hypothetical protein
MKLGEVLWRGLSGIEHDIEARVVEGEAIEDIIASYGGHPYYREGIRQRWEAFVALKRPDPLTLLSGWQRRELERISGAIAGLENARWQVRMTKELLDEATDSERREELQGSLDMARAELHHAMRTLKAMGLLKGEIPPIAPLKELGA